MKKRWFALPLLLLATTACYFFYNDRTGLPKRQQMLLQQPPLPADAVITRLVVRKGAREMDAYNAAGKLLKT